LTPTIPSAVFTLGPLPIVVGLSIGRVFSTEYKRGPALLLILLGTAISPLWSSDLRRHAGIGL
jgi:hypothetical protein